MQELTLSAADVHRKAFNQHHDLMRRKQQFAEAGVPPDRIASIATAIDAVHTALDAVNNASRGKSRVRALHRLGFCYSLLSRL